MQHGFHDVKCRPQIGENESVPKLKGTTHSGSKPIFAAHAGRAASLAFAAGTTFAASSTAANKLVPPV